MKPTYSVIVFLFFFTLCFGQAGQNVFWENTIAGYDYDNLTKAINTPDGGAILIGSSSSGIGIDKSDTTLIDSLSIFINWWGGLSSDPLDYWIVKLDSNGIVQWDKTYGGNYEDQGTDIINTSDGGYLVSGFSNSDSSAYKSQNSYSDSFSLSIYYLPYDFWILKLDINGNIEWERTIGGFNEEYEVVAKETNLGDFIIGGSSFSNIGGNKSANTKGGTINSDFWFLKLDFNGNILWDKTIGGASDDKLSDIEICNDGGFLLTGTSSSLAGYDKSDNPRGYNWNNNFYSYDIWLVKTDADGLIQWDRTIGGSSQDFGCAGKQTQDGGFIIGGYSSSSASYDKTAINLGSYDYWLLKTDQLGNVIWDKTYGGNNWDNLIDIEVSDYGGYIVGGTSSSNSSIYKTENSLGNGDYWIIKVNENGIKEWDNTLGGDSYDNLVSIDIDNNGNYLIGGSSNSNVSADKSEDAHYNDYWVLKIACTPFSDTIVNNLTYTQQILCAFGSPNVIEGTNDNLLFQDFISYQWEVSTDSVQWTELQNVNTQNYLPPPTSINTYYRRVAHWSCHNYDTSNVHSIIISADLAPTLDLGGNIYTCPNYPVLLGKDLSISGGFPPYQYSWDHGNLMNYDSIQSPEAITNTNTLFTLQVTDSLGCMIQDQVYVVVYKADAGPNQQYCVNQNPVQLGTNPLSGVFANYNWTPSYGLNNSNIAKPIASPDSTQNYILTVTYLNQDSTNCILSDTTTIQTIQNLGNFAGIDRTICYSTGVSLGAPAVPGFTYFWQPYSFVSNPTIAQPSFHQTTNIFNSDPLILHVTAQSENCIFTDEVEITVLGSQVNHTAGNDLCGSGRIGMADLTPNINETYSWTKLSNSTGSGNIIGPTDSCYAFVSGAGSGTDYYQLQISYNGVTCSDIVQINSNCGNASNCLSIDFPNPQCHAYNPNDTIYLSANGPSNGTFTWSVPYIWSSNSGNQIQVLLGDIDTVSVHWISNLDSNYTCNITEYFDTSNYYIEYPDFSINDTTVCYGEQITLGETYNPNYSYYWYFNGYNMYLPTYTSFRTFNVTHTTEGEYWVRVKNNITNCQTWDTAFVFAQEVIADAGFDSIYVCSASEITLGTPDISNGQYAYNWYPYLVPWLYGTDESFAQPTALIAASVDFTLTVTDTLYNCTAYDSVQIIVDPLPEIQKANDLFICLGDGIDIGIPPLYGASYSWTPAPYLSDANVAQPFANPPTTTEYYVEINLTGNCATPFYDTLTLNVFNPEFDLGNDITYCPGQSSVHIGQNAPTNGVASYSWSPGTGLNNSHIANPTSNFSGDIDYILTVTYLNGCSASDTISLISNSEAHAGEDQFLCEGEIVQVGDANNTGTILWSGNGSAFLNSLTSSTPIFNSNLSGSGNFQLIVATINSGCENKDTMNITVYGSPIVNNSFTVCQGACIQIGTLLNQPYGYQWLPSTGLNNPNIALPLACVDSSSTYTLRLTNYNNNCVFEELVQIDVVNVPPPSIQFAADSFIYCNDTTIQINPSTPFDSSYSYSWAPINGLSQIFTPATFASVANNNYTYTLTVTDNQTNCTNQSLIHFIHDCSLPEICNNGIDDDGDGLTDENDPDCYCSINTEIYSTFCQGEFFVLPNLDTIFSQGIYRDTLISSMQCDSIIINYLTVLNNKYHSIWDTICENDSYLLPNGNYVYTAGIYIDTLSSSNLCDSIITTHLFVNSYSFSSTYDTICKNDSLQLPNGNYVNNAGVYIDTLNIPGLCDSIITTHLYTIENFINVIHDTVCENEIYVLPNGSIADTSGLYVYNLTSGSSCDSIVEIHLLVKELLFYTHLSDTSICDEAAINGIDLHDYLMGTNYVWNNGTEGSVLIFDESGTYVVNFTQANNCRATDSIYVEIMPCTENCSILIPDAFSPNNDAVNNVFRVVTDCKDLTYFQMNIYNRWGELVYKSNDFNEGWNGKYNGAEQSIDVYTFIIQYQISASEKVKIVSGNLTLIR